MKKLLIILCFPVILYLPAQEASSRVKLIEVLAESRTPEQKFEALDSISSILDYGSMGEDEADLVRILGDLSSEGITNVKLDNGQIRNDFPAVRLEAVTLLGKTGSPLAKGALVSVLRYDNHLMVLSEAALVAAQLEAVPWSSFATYYYLILRQKKELYENDQLIRDVLSSIKIIALRDAAILEDSKIQEGISYIVNNELGLLKETTALARELNEWEP